MQLDAKRRGEVLALAGAASGGSICALRAGGVAVNADARAELLARAVAREFVSIEIDVLAYEQQAGAPNRNYVRFRDGALPALGRSGRGTPFLRDHEQDDVEARGGKIIASATTKLEEGHYQVLQTAELTEPTAVERALRGLMSTVSIGWRATGPVMCSACGTEVLDHCWHWPGDEIALDGGTSSVVIEWIFTAAELIETSEVNVPGVPTARIQEVRAELSAQGFRAAMAAQETRPLTPQENRMDKMKLALIGLLGLAATASDDEVTAAVTTLKRGNDALAASNAELAAVQARLTAEAEVARAAAKARDLTAFIDEQVQAGRCSPGTPLEQSLRDFFAVDQAGARKLAESMPRVTPVNQQSQRTDPPPPANPTALAGIDQAFASIGVSAGGVAKVLKQLGHSNPTAAVVKHGAQALGMEA